MIGFTPNEEQPSKATRQEQTADESTDFEKFRAELLTLESVERRDAYDDYNRGYRSF